MTILLGAVKFNKCCCFVFKMVVQHAKSSSNKNTVLIIIVTCISILAILIYGNNRLQDAKVLIVNGYVTNNISCHYETENDALPSVEEIKPKFDSIFFHETSCIGGLNSRKACAIESAARLHPNRTVYVLFNSPISGEVLNKSSLAILSQLPNVQFARILSPEYARGTELYDLLSLGSNTGSHYLVEHTADMLRFISLYKYGGIYLDSDMLLVKPLDRFGSNWAVRESQRVVNIAAMGFSRDGVGGKLTKLIIRNIKDDYRPDLWDYNGSGALKRALREICKVKQVIQMSSMQCQGFRIYNPITVYPIHWLRVGYYFVKEYEVEMPEILQHEDKIYGHHLWNKISTNYDVEKGSPFDKMARKYCPSTRNAYGDRFGE